MSWLCYLKFKSRLETGYLYIVLLRFLQEMSVQRPTFGHDCFLQRLANCIIL